MKLTDACDRIAICLNTLTADPGNAIALDELADGLAVLARDDMMIRALQVVTVADNAVVDHTADDEEAAEEPFDNFPV